MSRLPISLAVWLLEKPQNPEKEGYRFAGWYDRSGDYEWDFSKNAVSGTVNLYAKFIKTYQVTFTDGTQLTVRFGDLVPDAADDTDTGSTTTTSLCYLASDGAPGIVYEVKAAHKDAFAVTKESLLDTSTKETAAADDVVAEH